MEYQHGGDIYSQNVEFDYSANINPLGLPEGVKIALRHCLDAGICSLYPDSRCDGLKKALGACHQVPGQWIVCGNGAADLIYALVHALRPVRGLVTAPAFSEYGQAMRVCGCQTDYLYLKEENGFRFDRDELEARILHGGEDGLLYDIVFLCNPNNPTGIPASRELVLQAAAACASTGALLVVDECFCGFLAHPERCSVIGELGNYKNLFVLGAFTKLYAMAGLRLGYGLCSDGELVQKLNEVRQPWSVSGLALKAGEAALEEQEYVKMTKEIIGTGREWLRRELMKLGFTVYDSQANYLFFRNEMEKNGINSEAMTGTGDLKGWLYHGLLEQGILIRSCGNYPGLDSSFYRVCVKTMEENERLMKHIKKVMNPYLEESFRNGTEMEEVIKPRRWKK